MNFTEIANTRQSCRAYDAARDVEEEKLAAERKTEENRRTLAEGLAEILGMDAECVVERMRTKIPYKFKASAMELACSLLSCKRRSKVSALSMRSASNARGAKPYRSSTYTSS